MEVRNVVSALTAEQKESIDQFNLALKTNDATNFAQLIDKLKAIPDECSPFRALALKDDNLDGFNRCLDLLKKDVNLAASAYCSEKTKQQN